MTAGTNYVTNPSFSVNTTGWAATGGSLAQDSTQVQPGLGQTALKVTTTSATSYVTYSCAGLVVGQRYTASCYYLVPVASAFNVLVQAGAIAGWDSRGQYGRWGRISVAFTATATTVPIQIGTVGGGSSKVFFLDRVQVTDGDGLGPYFDGDYPQCAWTGTAGASTSTCAPLQSFLPTSEEMLLAGGLALQTAAWNITSKAGRYQVPGHRGDNTKVPGLSGSQYVKNKPVDTGLLTLNMWVLGTLQDGTVPWIGESRRIFETNLARLLQSLKKTYEAVTLTAWQADSSPRQTTAEINATTDGNLMAGGMRGEFIVAMEIIPGMWQDWFAMTIAGAAGAGWSNQDLTLTALVGGTAPIEDAVATVHGPIVNPVVSNPITGVSVTLTGTLSTTDVWVVDSGAWTSTLNGTSNIANVTHAGHPRFIVIPPGELLAAPVLHLAGTGTGTNTNLTVTARRKHWTA